VLCVRVDDTKRYYNYIRTMCCDLCYSYAKRDALRSEIAQWKVGHQDLRSLSQARYLTR